MTTEIPEQLAEESISRAYALLLVDVEKYNFLAINKIIIDARGMAALKRIKKKAWAYLPTITEWWAQQEKEQSTK